MNLPRSFASSLGAAIAVVALAQDAAAQVGVESTFVGDNPPVVDGSLDEWFGEDGEQISPFTTLGAKELVKGKEEWSDESDLSAEFSFAHNKNALFAAFKITDQRLVRTDALVPTEDHIEIWIGTAGEKGRTLGIGIYADPQKGPQAVEIRKMEPGKKRAGSKIKGAVGATTGGDYGYEVEVSIPWSALPGSSKDVADLKAGVFVVDCDLAAKMIEKSVLGTAPIEGRGSADYLPPIGLSETASGLTLFYGKTGLSSEVKSSYSSTANVAGDAEKEQVAVIDRYLLVLGTGLGNDGGYAYCDLPVQSSDQVTKFEIKELTGDDKSEIVLNIRSDDPMNSKSWMAVYRVGDNNEIKEIFSAITLLSNDMFRIENSYKFKKEKGNKNAIEISFKSAEGVDKDMLQEGIQNPAGAPMLMPWNKPSKAVYLFKDNEFVRK